MKKAFTLIELVVVVSILATIAGIVIIQTGEIQKNARDNKRKADLVNIQTALELYFATNRSYPSTTNTTTCAAPNVPAGVYWCSEAPLSNKGYSGPDAYIPNLAPTFINVLPSDPTKGRASSLGQSGGSSCGDSHAGYAYASNGTDYKIIAFCTLESLPSAGQQFYDPARPTSAFAVFSKGAATWRY